MYINSKNKQLQLEPLRGIITQGEKLADTVTFALPNVYGNLTLSSLGWSIRAASEKNTLATASLTVSVMEDKCLLSWEVSSDFTAVSGALSLMLVGTDGDGNVVIKFPGDSPIWVRDSETGEYSPPEDAVENALNGLQSAEEALQNAIEALQSIGVNLKILGWYPTLEALQAAVKNPSPGDIYGIGDPTVLYVWTGSAWTQLPGVFVQPSGFNFLVNSRFAYNGRNQESYTGEGWTVDGWLRQGGNVTVVSSGGILLDVATSGIGNLFQPIKYGESLLGKTVTFSVCDSTGSIYSVTGTYPSVDPGQNFQIAVSTSSFGSISLWNSNGFGSPIAAVISITTPATITAAKLELGPVSTLAADLEKGQDETIEQLRLDMYDLDPGRPAYILTQNENLLDNWYFVGGGSQQGGGQFPINQRGQTSYTAGDYQYCIDRWLQDGENVTIVDNGIKIEAQDTTDLDNKIYQRIESVPHNIPLTFSAIIDNKLYIVQGMSFTPIQNVVNDFIKVEIGEENGRQYALIRNTQGSITIQAAKLERGFLSTLASKNEAGDWVLNDPPPNFQQELAKCQRYLLMGSLEAPFLTANLAFLPVFGTRDIIPSIIGTPQAHTTDNNFYVPDAVISLHGRILKSGVAFTISGTASQCYVFFPLGSGLSWEL